MILIGDDCQVRVINVAGRRNALECAGHGPAHETLRQRQTGTDKSDKERYQRTLGSGGEAVTLRASDLPLPSKALHLQPLLTERRGVVCSVNVCECSSKVAQTLPLVDTL